MKKPFYRSNLDCWYVKDDAGRFIRLDPNKKHTHEMWQAMLQRDAGLALKRVVKWAHGAGHIRADLLQSLKLEEPAPRDQLVGQDAHSQMVTNARASRSKSFALYLIASHCGARPKQIREVEAVNVVTSSNAIMDASAMILRNTRRLGRLESLWLCTRPRLCKQFSRFFGTSDRPERYFSTTEANLGRKTQFVNA